MLIILSQTKIDNLAVVVYLIYFIVALLTALTIHEASHALAAYLMGDPTPKQAGRLSLNPLAHLDPLGALMILLVGLGWGKPVMIKAENLKPGPKLGMAFIALAGPVSNLLLAFIFALPIRFHLVSLLDDVRIPLDFLPVRPFDATSVYVGVGPLLAILVLLNLSLALFNLIPINPLDGSRVWQIILPTRLYLQIARIELIGLFLIQGLVISDLFFGTKILLPLLIPPRNALWWLLVNMAPPGLM